MNTKSNKIIGDEVKRARKNQGMSQSQLAKGICTQATISSIENHNICTNLEIINQLCDRLQIKLVDVLGEPKESNHCFKEMVKDVIKFEFIDFKDKFNNIKPENLSKKELLKYYVCCGVFNTIEDNAPIGINYFHKFFAKISKTDYLLSDYCYVANMGLAIIYQELSNKEEAKEYFNAAIAEARFMKGDTEYSIEMIVDMFENILTTGYQTIDVKTRLELTEEIIVFVRHKESTYKMISLLMHYSNILREDGNDLKASYVILKLQQLKEIISIMDVPFNED